MDQNSNTTPVPGSRKIKSFWAIAVIFLVAALAGIVVYWFQFQFNYNEELNSIGITIQSRRMNAHLAPEAPADDATVTATGTDQ